MPAQFVHPHETDAAPVVPGLRAADVLALMQMAPDRDGARAGLATRPLDGRHVALVALRDSHPSAQVFSDAAQALGASITRIAPANLALGDVVSACDTARMLGRLYAAIGCAGLDVKSVSLLKNHCGVPIFVDLAANTHASRLLAKVMTLQQAARETASSALPLPSLATQQKNNHRLVVQALLCSALGAQR